MEVIQEQKGCKRYGSKDIKFYQGHQTGSQVFVSQHEKISVKWNQNCMRRG